MLSSKYLVNMQKTYSRLITNKNFNLNFHTTEIVNRNEKIFLRDKYSEFTLGQLSGLSKNLSKNLLKNLNCNDLKGEKIAVLCSNNYTYLVSLMAIWQANGVPLGLNKNYPPNLLEYFINDSKCKLVVNGVSPDETKSNADTLNSLLEKQNVHNYQLIENEYFRMDTSNEVAPENSLDYFRGLLNKDLEKEALILYTSGTSGPPKGVVLTRGNMTATIETLIDTWEWSSKDTLLHVLPLNHVHGLTYALLTTAYSGASVDMLPKFNVELVWSKLLDENDINCFMAVPTIFVQLVNYYLKNDEIKKKYSADYIKNIFKKKIRLIASGSASLNVKTYDEWNEITGYKILERYGMTEIGLGLTNPYEETDSKKRVAGCVGRPYGETSVRIVEPNSDVDSKHVVVESRLDEDIINDQNKELFGELQIKGNMVFREYLGKPVQTKETFADDGWFKTGDTAVFLKDEKIYKLLGRTSVDVIKSGGYKISALDIEKELLAYPLIEEVCVMGISDPEWGQRIFSLIVLKEDCADKFDKAEYIKWCKTRLPRASVPTLVKAIDKLPKNQLGKVNKKELIKKYEAENSFL